MRFAGTVAESAPIIPISAQLKYNIDAINEYIVKRIPIPPRDFLADPRLIVIRSFDVNKPGAEIAELKGGVAGGSILTGVLKLGDEIEVRPGVVTKDSEGKVTCTPIFSRIVSLFAEQNDLKFAVPGGLIGKISILLMWELICTGVGLKVDPTLCRSDRLVGQVLGSKGKLPPVYTELEINYFLLRRYMYPHSLFADIRLLGVKATGDDKKQTKVQKLTKGEVLMVNIGSTSSGGKVLNVKVVLYPHLLLSIDV